MDKGTAQTVFTCVMRFVQLAAITSRFKIKRLVGLGKGDAVSFLYGRRLVDGLSRRRCRFDPESFRLVYWDILMSEYLVFTPSSFINSS